MHNFDKDFFRLHTFLRLIIVLDFLINNTVITSSSCFASLRAVKNIFTVLIR
jgi:hypothetical protein